MLKTFLKPGWVLMTLFVIAFSYLAFTVLAPWQLGKDGQIVERNHDIEAAYEAEPQPVGDVMTATGEIKGAEWTRVTLTGHYLSEDEVLLRLRPVESTPAFQSLVPFQTDSGLTLLINRGWVPTDEGNKVPDIAPATAEETTIVGMVHKDEALHSSKPVNEQGYEQVYSINTEQVGELTGVALGKDYVQLSPDQPGVLNALPVPQLERGNHLSYGYQWIAFGIMAPAGLGYFIWAELKERRRAREEEAALASAAALGDAPQPAPHSAPSARTEPTPAATAATEPTDDSRDELSAEPAAQPSPSRRSRSRYGDSKPDFYENIRKRGRERY